jgi:hypothetical protein
MTKLEADLSGGSSGEVMLPDTELVASFEITPALTDRPKEQLF